MKYFFAALQLGAAGMFMSVALSRPVNGWFAAACVVWVLLSLGNAVWLLLNGK